MVFTTLNSSASKDIEITQPPTDGISDLDFSPQADILAAASWDNQVRLWEVQNNGSTVGKLMYAHDGPVLCCRFSKDGTKLFSGGADKSGKLLDMNTGQSIQILQHDAPIKCCRFLDGQDILATGSWDKTLKYWDMRTPNPVAVVNLPERCYTMDTVGQLLVVGTAEKHIQVFNLSNPTTPYKTVTSPLKFQTRVVSCFPAANGFAVGSIEGRVGIQYVEDKDSGDNFSFKCHRDNNNVYSVNAIVFHPIHRTFATAGSDGTFHFWDKDSKQRIKMFPSINQPIPCASFNRTGNILAYAASYDWSKGHEHRKTTQKDTIYLHPVNDDDIKPRAKKR